jgi:hypothetical protein
MRVIGVSNVRMIGSRWQAISSLNRLGWRMPSRVAAGWEVEGVGSSGAVALEEVGDLGVAAAGGPGEGGGPVEVIDPSRRKYRPRT